MQFRLGLFVSLLLNALLAVLLVRHWRQPAPIVLRHPIVQQNITIKTNVIQQASTPPTITPQINWTDIQGQSIENYVANLRALHCPEPVLRKIIVHEVNELYSHRIATEIVGGDHQWWKSTPDPDLVEQGLNKLTAMETESNALLTRLLGPGWETSVEPNTDEKNHAGVYLTGPVLGDLPDELKKKVYELSEQTRDAVTILSQKGMEGDPTKVNAITQQWRTELAKVLTPPQLEEYLLRYSDTAQKLRNEFQDIDVTPDQFRAAFRLRDSIGQQMEQYPANDPTSAAVRQNMLMQQDIGMQQALGQQLYAAYKTSQDPLFQQARQTVDAAGGAPEIIGSVYEINQLTQSTVDRIQNNRAITEDEREAAIATVRQQQARAVEQLLQSNATPPLPGSLQN